MVIRAAQRRAKPS